MKEFERGLGIKDPRCFFVDLFAHSKKSGGMQKSLRFQIMLHGEPWSEIIFRGWPVFDVLSDMVGRCFNSIMIDRGSYLSRKSKERE